MKIKISLLFLVLMVMTSFVAKVLTPPTGDCEILNTSFTASEKLVFKAYYNWKFVWVPAGEAVFTIKENRFDYEVRVVGTTYESYDNFFRVRDYFYSKIDKKTMYPKNFVRIIEEGDYRKYDSISFDQQNKLAYSYVGKSKNSTVKKVMPLQDCTHDLLSVLYFMRNIKIDDYKVNTYIPTNVFFDNGNFPIKVTYKGKEKNKSIRDLGKYNTIRVVPDLVVGNVFKDGNKMNVWVTDDGNKLPLMVESPLKVGYAKAVLKSYSGLRNPFTSKVK